MKILHAPENIAGIPGVLAAEQRRLGYDATSYTFSSGVYGYHSDIFMNNPASKAEKIRRAIQYALRYNVFQFSFGASLLGPTLLDVPWLARMGKKVFFYFHGCDIRDADYITSHYPVSGCAACSPRLCSANREKAAQVSAKYGIVNFVSTPDLLEFVQRGELLPQAVDFEMIAKLGSVAPRRGDGDTLRIAHAPTNRLLKGTDILLGAVERLQSKGLGIELVLVENMPHEDALRAYRDADLAVDGLLMGIYGLLSAEMMALGVPVVNYLREDLVPLYPEKPPMINIHPETLERELERLYHDRSELRRLAGEGPGYAMRVHHPEVLAKKCIQRYEEAFQNKAVKTK